MQLRSGGQYELGMKPAQGGGDWTHHQAAETNNPVITCHGLTPGTRYLFRGRAGTVLGFRVQDLGLRLWGLGCRVGQMGPCGKVCKGGTARGLLL